MRASRGLAVDGDDLGGGAGRGWLAQALDPGGETLGKERPVDGVDDVVQGVVAGDPGLVGQQAAEEVLVHLTPAPDLHEILSPGQRAAQHQQKDFRQRKQNLPGLARVLQRSKVFDQRCTGHRETSSTRGPL